MTMRPLVSSTTTLTLTPLTCLPHPVSPKPPHASPHLSIQLKHLLKRLVLRLPAGTS